MTIRPLDPRLDALHAVLRSRSAIRVQDRAGVGRAAVALVVRPEAATLELLLIKRAPRSGDPWSGHIALPGGKSDPLDSNTRATAIRETLEEVGIPLDEIGSYLGSLDEIQPLGAGVPALTVSPYAFAVLPETRAAASQEVEAAFWVPVPILGEPESQAEYLHAIGDGRTLRFPAFEYQGHTIWGLTYRILTQFLSLIAIAAERPR
jgi:8-oxo-dGTP pyrophosphatase MutT (NUDIX family)